MQRYTVYFIWKLLYIFRVVESSWNMLAHGDVREEKWKGNKRMEWVTSKRHMTAEHRLARAVQTPQVDVHSSPASSRLNWRHRRFKWTRPFRRKTKSGSCACAITFQTQSTAYGYGYIGARTDTTQQSGLTPGKAVEIKNITVYVRGYSDTDTTGMLSPTTVWPFSVAINIKNHVFFYFYFLI